MIEFEFVNGHETDVLTGEDWLFSCDPNFDAFRCRASVPCMIILSTDRSQPTRALNFWCFQRDMVEVANSRDHIVELFLEFDSSHSVLLDKSISMLLSFKCFLSLSIFHESLSTNSLDTVSLIRYVHSE